MDLDLQSAFATGYERLSAWADLLDTINVYPVADADTGSNLMISLAPLHRMASSTDSIVQKLLVSALGNSGNIASGFFTGFVAENPLKDMYQATKTGRDRAWRALADPKPGTMLTVFDELLNQVEHLSLDQLAATYPALIERLENAVHSTSETLPTLRAAGVVDAGALGIFLFMEGFFGHLAGRTDVFRPITETFRQKLQLSSDFVSDRQKGYCVDTVIQVGVDFDSSPDELSKYGENVVVLRKDDRVKIHLHTEQREGVRKQIEDLGRVVQWSEQDMGLQARKRPHAAKPQAIHIVTDAAGSITREDAVRLGITLLDSYIIVGDKSLPETLYSPAELYALMRKGVKVSTAQASVFERHQRYESILSRFGLALYLCVGSVYTGNYETVSAWKAQNDRTNRLTVIDTGLASGRLGIAALATARYGAWTDQAEKVVRFAEAAVRNSKEYIFLDRLQYLVAGGRLSKTKGFFGDMLHLKPIITPTPEGAVKAGTARNQSEQIEFAMEKLEMDLGQDAESIIMLEYSDNCQWVEDNVLDRIKGRYPTSEVIFQPLSLTSGAHMGPGTWGLAFLPLAFRDLT
jgi:DegV family protein with EDD domain